LNTLYKPWFDLSRDAVSLTCEAGHVIGLRMVLAVLGGAAALDEVSLMVSEKATAAMDAHFMVAHSLMAGEGHLAPARTVALYRSRVQANQQRLMQAA
jgi:hypothetical protein